MRLLPHGAKIGKATVIVDIISKNNPEIRPGGHMNPTYITDHDTGNRGLGANAEMHNRYIHNMASYHPRDTSHVSWHVTVDENYIYQHLPFDEPAYHCGDGFGVKSGNRTSIGVEKAMNIDGNRAQTEENAIALHVYLLKNAIKKTPSNVVPHQYWSGKYCPAVILKRDGSFNPFRKRIQDAYNGNVKVSKPKQTAVKTSKSSTNNNSIVDYLNAQGISSSFANRKKLAAKHGIKNYAGTASQNTQLLNKLKGSSTVSKPKAKSKSISLPNATYWVKNPLFNGSGVRAVQEALASVYFYPEKGAKNNGIDGYYGAKTADAVRRFQSVNGLKADGDYGPATRAKLLQVMK